MTETNDSRITLTLRGARAKRGVTLADFETFIDSFLSALRDYDRAVRGEPTQKTGHPDKRASAVTAFRLVSFETGSGIATIEPDGAAVEDDQIVVGDPLLAVVTLRGLVGDLAAGTALPESVVSALEKARRSVGDDGTIEIVEVARPTARITVDAALLGPRAPGRKGASSDDRQSVSGRLHLLDLEPDRLGIRTSGGAEWMCRYPEEIEERVTGLLGRIVWVEGPGRLTTPQRGAMTIERIEPVDDVEQPALFTVVPIREEALLIRQGISAPQGLDALSDPEWDDEADGAYLAAMLGS